MSDLRRIDFQAALEEIEQAHHAEKRSNSELRIELARTKAWLDRIFKAENVDSLYEVIRRAEDDLETEVRA